jgi:hypothetical protein
VLIRQQQDILARNADYQIGYADAVLDAIKKLRGEQSD